jgi:hypothetical protein
MPRNRALIFAGVIAAGMLAAPAAEADWRYRGGGWGPRYYAAPRYYGPGPAIAGAILGLGVGAAIAGAYAAPPYYYAPPPPVYYAPPPAPYYYGPGWVSKPGW